MVPNCWYSFSLQAIGESLLVIIARSLVKANEGQLVFYILSPMGPVGFWLYCSKHGTPEDSDVLLPPNISHAAINAPTIMWLKALGSKLINRICAADITKVLYLDVDCITLPLIGDGISCTAANHEDLSSLAPNQQFALNQALLAEYERSTALAVIATLNGTAVGLCFLASGYIAAKHNSGGKRFSGIAIDLPENTYYLFKVYVLPEARGQRVLAAMIQFAIETLGPEAQHLLTTTDWTNDAFLSASQRLGFSCQALAAEVVVAGKRFYHIPQSFTVSSEARFPAARRPAARRPAAQSISFYRPTD